MIPFLGAGASVGSRNPSSDSWPGVGAEFLPASGELAGYLAEEAEYPEPDPQDLAKVAQYAWISSGRTGLHAALRPVFNRDYQPLPVHEYLASIEVPLLIVTTNYDTLVEDALTSAGRPHDIVVQTTDEDLADQVYWIPHDSSVPELKTLGGPGGLDIDLSARTVVYKIHGSVNRTAGENDQYLITEDDYVSFLGRMTGGKAIPMVFAEAFQTRQFLFLGHGLGDWNLRVLLNRLQTRPSVDDPSWAIQKDVTDVEKEFWSKRGVNVYEVDVTDFVGGLND